MSYYHVIFTDLSLEEILEKHPEHPKTWMYGRHDGTPRIMISEGDYWGTDPNGAGELRLTGHYYSVGCNWANTNVLLRLADDYSKRMGGKIYVIELSLSEDYISEKKDYMAAGITEKIETLDLKNVSKILQRGTFEEVIRLHPYVIYEVVNSAYERK
ncbi:MAG: hypothetical protein FWD81_05590 [Methanomassiliicoccaceae archaeon]|nr:hypothetical protein [Methanomassiliicoccaceae archaeon]